MIWLRRLPVVSALLALAAACGGSPRPEPAPGPAVVTQASPRAEGDAYFARLSNELSEPGGFFDSDNIISNETSYLHVLQPMERLAVRGGAYVGVGPSQNFTYIAAIRPSIAYLIDIRRDNLLEHLLFRAMFSMSRNRLEYLCLLFGKPLPPGGLERWNDRPIADLVAYIDNTPTRADIVAITQAMIDARIASWDLQLSERDKETIGAYRAGFIRDSLSVRYSSLNRAPRPNHPTYRRLLLETDLEGRQRSYLASEESFQYLKEMHERGRMVPVVGNVAGTKALAAIGRDIAARGEKVSALYLSNVEQYLFRDGSFAAFAETASRLPRDERSVIIRSYFGFFGSQHPSNVPGHLSTSIVQTLDSFAQEFQAGRINSYLDIITRNYLEP